jgi:hypothetical protein
LQLLPAKLQGLITDACDRLMIITVQPYGKAGASRQWHFRIALLWSRPAIAGASHVHPVDADARTGFGPETRFQSFGEHKGMIDLELAAAQTEHQVIYLVGNFKAVFGLVRFTPE